MSKEFISPLKAWPGKFTLPDPNEFNRNHWDAWKAAVQQPKRSSYSDTHLFGYAGLDLVARYGTWAILDGTGEPLPIPTVRSWEDDPEAERMKLISWIGREIMYYNAAIVDPKE